MKRLLTLAVLSCLAAPAAFAVPPSGPNPSQLCKEQLRSMGAASFQSLYPPTSNGKNAFGTCVSRQSQVLETNAENAAKACKTERGTTPESIETFNNRYGPQDHPNKKNAFGKCVSMKARGLTEAQQNATLNAAKTCKTLRASNRAAFDATYGTKKNAFGKCVSKNAKPATP